MSKAKRKPPDGADLAIESILLTGVASGDYEQSFGPDGEARYKITEQGRRKAEALLRASPVAQAIVKRC